MNSTELANLYRDLHAYIKLNLSDREIIEKILSMYPSKDCFEIISRAKHMLYGSK